MGRAMSFDRAWIFVVLAADAIWLAAPVGRQFGLGGFVHLSAELVTRVLLAAVLCALASRLVWGRVRRIARQKAGRATAGAEKARTGGGHAGGTVASQAIAAAGSVGCAAVFVSADRGSPVLRSAHSALSPRFLPASSWRTWPSGKRSTWTRRWAPCSTSRRRLR
jgi:hypothetical protein